MLRYQSKIKVFIFDLDDTLYDCSGTLVLRGRRKVAKTIAGLINCSEEKAFQLQLKIEEKYGIRTNIYEKIVELYNLPTTYAKELLDEFIHVDITNITLFPDVMNTLIQLKAHGYKLILVSSGDEVIQRRKIAVLGLKDNYFDEILITDRNNGYTKNICFKEIMQRYNSKPGETVCVGDKIDDELAAGKFLGVITIMFEHGRHFKAYLKEQDKHIKPDYFIKHIKDILKLNILNNLQANRI